jgi:hypothetical protein
MKSRFVIINSSVGIGSEHTIVNKKSSPKCGWGYIFLSLVLAVTVVSFVCHHSGSFSETDQTRQTTQTSQSTKQTPKPAPNYISRVFDNVTLPGVLKVPLRNTNVFHSTNPVLLKVQQTLASHPFHRLTSEERNTFALEDYLHYLHQQPECRDKPIFTSMANVFSDLYWQL